MRTWRLGPLFLSCLVATGCGGGDTAPGQTGDNQGSVITIRGGERLAWDQPVDSPAAAKALTFTLYVDGVPAPITEVRCADERSAAGVSCSGRLPSMGRGSHTLELSATVNGFASGRSAPLNVSVSSVALFGGASIGASTPGVAPGGIGVACLQGVSSDCYESRVMASGLGVVTAPIATDAGLLFVEDGNRIRIVVADSLLPEPALTFDGGERITGLAVPPDFDRTHVVFVAWSEPSRDGGETLNLTRYRELAGALGEGATIVTGLPLSPGGAAPIAIDDRGLVYVSLSAAQPASAPSATAWSNFILRFDADGGVPGTNPTSSPVIAHGYARPSALVWDGVRRELWLAGSDPRWSSPVSTLQIGDGGRAEWPWLPVSVADSPLPPGPPALALTADRVDSRLQHVWLATADGALQRGATGSTQLLRLDSIELGPARVASVADGLGGSLIVVTRSEPATTYDISRLTPLDHRFARPQESELLR